MVADGTRAAGSGGKGGSSRGGGKATPAMTREEVRHFLEALALANPDPRSELSYTNPYTLLVAVALSAQTTDVAVNRATETLFKEAPDAKAMVALGVEGVGRHIRRLGLWQTKARNVVEMSRLLEERHGGEVPNDRAALEALPGVGRKTANVVLNVAFGEATMAVDTHIFRLGNRTGIAPGKTTREVEDGLVRRCPPDMLRLAHHWLILHGRYVCKARLPECWRCVAAKWCRFPAKTQAPAVARAVKAAQKTARKSPAQPKAGTGKPAGKPTGGPPPGKPPGKRGANVKPKQAADPAD
jgi:endonuclease-3